MHVDANVAGQPVAANTWLSKTMEKNSACIAERGGPLLKTGALKPKKFSALVANTFLDVAFDPEIPKCAALRVYLVLRTFRNEETGRCYPCVDTLVECAGINERNVRYALDELERLQIIKVKHRRNSCGQRTSSQYNFVGEDIPLKQIRKILAADRRKASELTVLAAILDRLVLTRGFSEASLADLATDTGLSPKHTREAVLYLLGDEPGLPLKDDADPKNKKRKKRKVRLVRIGYGQFTLPAAISNAHPKVPGKPWERLAARPRKGASETLATARSETLATARSETLATYKLPEASELHEGSELQRGDSSLLLSTAAARAKPAAAAAAAEEGGKGDVGRIGLEDFSRLVDAAVPLGCGRLSRDGAYELMVEAVKGVLPPAELQKRARALELLEGWHGGWSEIESTVPAKVIFTILWTTAQKALGRGTKVGRWSYFEPAIRDFIEEVKRGLPASQPIAQPIAQTSVQPESPAGPAKVAVAKSPGWTQKERNAVMNGIREAAVAYTLAEDSEARSKAEARYYELRREASARGNSRTEIKIWEIWHAITSPRVQADKASPIQSEKR